MTLPLTHLERAYLAQGTAPPADDPTPVTGATRTRTRVRNYLPTPAPRPEPRTPTPEEHRLAVRLVREQHWSLTGAANPAAAQALAASLRAEVAEMLGLLP